MNEPPTAVASTAGAARLPALDGLRGVAVLMVVIMHYYTRIGTPDDAVGHLLLRSSCNLFFSGVDLFFVLSGFLIGGILLDHRDSPRLLPAFYARRSFRILPLYALLLASFFVARADPELNQVNFGTYFSSTVELTSFFFFLQNFAMAATRDIGPYWLGPSWSLAVEEQFYLLMPLLVRRLSRERLVQLCVALIFLAPSLRIAALVFAQNGFAAVFLLPMRIDALLCGVLCAIIVRSTAGLEAIRCHRRVLEIAVVGSLLIFFLLSQGSFEAASTQIAPFGYSFFACLFSGVLLHVVVLPEAWLARVLAFRPLAAIGVVSYFIYLFHTPVWYVLHWLSFGRSPQHHTWVAGSVTLLSLVVTLIASAISWRYFEAPLLRFSRRWNYA